MPKIILEDAKYKPLAMLLYFLHIGYIPGNTQFYDDRIHNFAGADAVLRKILPELQSCRFFRVSTDSSSSIIGGQARMTCAEVKSILTESESRVYSKG